ncbi:MAG TPA: DoxX family protein [Longimicrobium sp.]|nr:DoxX family protein [Longimicrobium sp.]
MHSIAQQNPALGFGRTDTTAAPASRWSTWGGRVLTALPVLFLLMDGVMKLMNPAPVVESMQRLGYDPALAVGLGVLQLLCLAAYVVPRTSVIGAILLTGYLGGAVATHARVGDPAFSHTLFPVYVGILLWAGLYLREPRLRALVPLRG